MLGGRNSHLIHCKVLKPVRVKSKPGLGCPQPQDTTPTFTNNEVFSFLMPPQQETEKSVSKKPTQNKINKKRKRFCCSVTDKETHRDRQAGDLY